jgi:hypothetical protein
MELPQVERLGGRLSLTLRADGVVAGIGSVAGCFHEARPVCRIELHVFWPDKGRADR